MSPSRLIMVIALCLLMGISGAGCGDKVVDHVKAEEEVEARVEAALKVDIRSTSCPEGQHVVAKRTFRCLVVAGSGEELEVRVLIRNQQADLRIVGVRPVEA